MAKPETKELSIGGAWTNGHPAKTPDGYCRTVENFVLSHDGLWKRPPFLDDSLANCVGLAMWDSPSDGLLRPVAFVTNGSNVDTHLKAIATETWTLTGAGSTAGLRVRTYANYRGKMYYPLIPQASFNGDPGPIMSFDGTGQTANALGGETLRARTITSFVDRLFLGYVQATVTNQLGTTTAYDSTDWSATTATTTNITNGTSITSRVTPTNTSTAKIQKANVYTVASNTKDTKVVFMSDLRNQSATYEMPMTMEIYYSQAWVADTVMAVGAIRVPTTLNGFRYRVTAIAGDFKTDASTEPAWPTTVGTTVVDDQVTWICDGIEQIAARAVTLPTLSSDAAWIRTYLRAVIPPMPAAANIGVRLKFGTPAQPTIELYPVDISFKDGLSDGAVGKANKGQQLTVGGFEYPFINRQSTATATITLENDIYWTETSNPNAIEGNNFFNLSEVSGPVTAAIAIGGRYLVFKGTGMWVFQGSPDPENPLVKERFLKAYGCDGAASIHIFNDKVYFSDRYAVYEYEPGGEPRIIDYAIRETIPASAGIAPGSRTSYIGGDPAGRNVWVSFGGATLYIFNTERQAWTTFAADFIADNLLDGIFFRDMVFAPDRDVMYAILASFPSVARADVYRMRLGVNGAAAGRDADAHAILGKLHMPIAPLSPQAQRCVDSATVHYYTSDSSQDADGLSITVTDMNSGSTLGTAQAFTLSDTTTGYSQRAKSNPRATGQLMMLQIEHSGDGGEEGLTIHAVEVETRTIGPARNMSSTEGNV